MSGVYYDIYKTQKEEWWGAAFNISNNNKQLQPISSIKVNRDQLHQPQY